MTCGLAVKRPHDYEAYLCLEESAVAASSAAEADVGAPVDAKRPRHHHAHHQTPGPHCSPFRPQLGTLATSLMQTTTSTNGVAANSFAEKAKEAKVWANPKLNNHLAYI